MSELKCVAIFSTLPEGQLAKAFLESEDISSVVFTDNEGGQLPGVNLSGGGVQLLVREELYEQAKSLMEQYEAQGQSESESEKAE